ncbi:hypothetical protein I79_022439 [Cricetulus griseus]|uniref:Uncharacterized protein n=1 Tax=Cricetulus griseus TaxID=10029 RepID=G3IFB8_CRIGR|nr:hypothetical protein I79_022439 [Cricetulus griseus]
MPAVDCPVSDSRSLNQRWLLVVLNGISFLPHTDQLFVGPGGFEAPECMHIQTKA